MDLKTTLAGGTAALMAAATGVQQFRVMGLDESLSSAKEVAQQAMKSKDQLANEKDAAAKALAEARDGAVAGAKRTESSILDLQAKLERANEELAREKGRNESLESTIGNLAEKLCPAPAKRR